MDITHPHEPASIDNPDGLLVTTAQVRAPNLKPDELRTLLNSIAPDPSVFDEKPPYGFMAEISNNTVDSYGTRMLDSTLQNFADDAKAGVSFQNSHLTFMWGFGRSIDGAFIGSGATGRKRVQATFYTQRGLTSGPVTSDEFIDRVRSGIAFDVSVGFYGGEVRCSICNLKMFASWRDNSQRCPHVAGLLYDKVAKSGEKTGDREMAIGLIDGAHLAEVSIVYDGATPNASILKAQIEAAAGRMNPAMATMLEQRYRGMGYKTINLSGDRRQWRGNGEGAPSGAPPNEPTSDRTQEEATTLPDQNELEERTRQLAAVRSALTLAGIAADRDPAEAIADLRQRLAERDQTIADLTPHADYGRAERARLIEETLKVGTAAFGKEWDTDLNRRMLDGLATPDEIEKVRASHQRTFDALYPGGSRVRTEGGEPRPSGTPASRREPISANDNRDPFKRRGVIVAHPGAYRTGR